MGRWQKHRSLRLPLACRPEPQVQRLQGRTPNICVADLARVRVSRITAPEGVHALRTGSQPGQGTLHT